MINFTKRLTRPTASNKEYITAKYKGGWSQCIQGSPTDKTCDVLANCVGYACGRFNEIYNEIKGTTGMKYPALNCNAENFIERAKSYYPELQFSEIPAPGAIIVWRKGKAGVSSDGAGHVAVVEEVIDDNTIITSESAYAGSAFYVSTRKNDNGRWGLNSSYAFRYFILNPAVGNSPIIPVDRDKWSNQIEIKISTVRMRKEPSLYGGIYGFITPGIYNVLDTKISDGYTWYQLGKGFWCADTDGDNEEEVAYYPKKEWIEPQQVKENTKNNQVYIEDIALRVRENPSTNDRVMGLLNSPNAYFDVYEVEVNSEYTWYKLGENSWIAGVDGVLYYPFQEASTEKELKEEIKELKSELNRVESIVASLEQENIEINKDLESAKEQIKSQNNSISALEKEKAKNEAKLNSIMEHIEAISKII